jgi:hypothetical protein
VARISTKRQGKGKESPASNENQEGIISTMNSIQFPHGRWNNAHDLIEEATRTNTPIADLIGRGLPADYTQEQLIEAHLNGECSETYLARRLKVDNLEVRRILQERQGS